MNANGILAEVLTVIALPGGGDPWLENRATFDY